MEVEDLIYCTLVGLECVTVDWNRIRQLLEEHQR
jgi:phosphoribosyl-ATP pyrophosphohydrolase